MPIPHRLDGEPRAVETPAELLRDQARFYDSWDMRYPLFVAGVWTEDDFPADGALAILYYLAALVLDDTLTEET